MSEWKVSEATGDERRQLARREHELFGPGGALDSEWLLDRNPAGKGLVLVARTEDGRMAALGEFVEVRLENITLYDIVNYVYLLEKDTLRIRKLQFKPRYDNPKLLNATILASSAG